jgi:hypothetical protein
MLYYLIIMDLLIQELKKVSFRQRVRDSSGKKGFVTESERSREKPGKGSEQRKFIDITQQIFSFLETVETMKSTPVNKNTRQMLLKLAPSSFLATGHLHHIIIGHSFVINPKFDYNFIMKNLLIDSGRRPLATCGATTKVRLSLSGFQDDSSSIVSCPARTDIRVTDIQRLAKVSKRKGGTMLVGIDWGREFLQVVLLTIAGKVIASVKLENTYKGYLALLEQLRGKAEEVIFAIENRNLRLVDFLIAHGFNGFYVNPNAMKGYRARYKSASVKSDELDAYILADLLRTDRHNLSTIGLDNPLVRELKGLLMDRERLVKDQTRLSNRLTRIIHTNFQDGKF